MKLNLGSNRKRIDGFTNVDVQDLDGVDIVWDLTKCPYPFEKDSIEEIISEEFLEHISFRYTFNVLREWYRILKPSGKILIQVPDIGKMCHYYVNNQICSCVPHKKGENGFKADPDCPYCHGEAMINDVRWTFAFTGAQKNEFDIHRNIFTHDYLVELLTQAGFKNIKKMNHIYKLVLEVKK